MRVGRLAARLVAATLCGATGGIHLDLWLVGYRRVPNIGPSFVLVAVVGAVLAVAFGVVRGDHLPVLAAAGAAYCAACLVAVWLSLTVGLLGFQEYAGAPWLDRSIAVEGAGLAVMAAMAAVGAVPLVRRAHR